MSKYASVFRQVLNEHPHLLTQIRRGVEKESLRVTEDQATLAQTQHPTTLGSALTHPAITTDYSEALLEFITPAESSIEATEQSLADLHRFTARQLNKELLWNASMPCIVSGDAEIPIAQFGQSNVGQMKRIYRNGLSVRYGRKVLAAVGQIDGNLRRSITQSLPDKAPSFFFLDIQSSQLPGFKQRLAENPAVSKVETAPMLRGLVTKINQRPAADVGGDHWVLRGDRGISYADGLPDQTKITAGRWWGAGYNGPPQVSFAAEEAEEIGIGLGDQLTLNVLGRDIVAEITSLREVDFSTAGMGFVILLNEAALKGAPHSHIATVYADAAAEIPILDELNQAFPNVTGIQIREAAALVTGVVSSIASAASIGALATLITGFLILIGAAAASVAQRAYESAILKTLGATRREILTSFVLRSAMIGALAASVALGAGLLGGWAVSHFVFENNFEIIWRNAALVILGGIGLTLVTNMLFALGPLSQSAASELRHRD